MQLKDDKLMYEAYAHEEQDMNNPEEKAEVCIARQILDAVKLTDMKKISDLAKELLEMHGALYHATS